MRPVFLCAIFFCSLLPLTLSAAEHASVPEVAAEQLTPDEQQSVLAFGLQLTLPADWQPEVSISPRILCWRGPNTTSPVAESATKAELIAAIETRYANPSITVTQSPLASMDEIAAAMASYQATILDLYANAEMVAQAKDNANPYGHPFFTMRYDIGPLRWQQLILFVNDPAAGAANNYIVVLSSSAEHWNAWQNQRGITISDLVFPAADSPARQD